MENPNNKFDAQLVMVSDGEMDKSETRLYHHDICVIPPYKVLNYAAQREKEKRLGESDTLIAGIFGDPKKRLDALKAEYGDEVVEAMLKGRLKLTQLLDCGGGPIISGNARMAHMDYVQSRNGRAESYLKYAAGDAATLFLKADEKLIVSDAELWITPLIKGSEEFRKIRNLRMRRDLNAVINPAKKDELAEKIKRAKKDNPKKPDFSFDSHEMVDFGIVRPEMVFSDLDALREEFAKRTQIALLPESLSNPFEERIKAFFQ